MTLKKRDVENIKIAMLRKYGETNFKKLANELNVSRQSIYNAINNKPYCDNIKVKLKEWLLDNA